MRLGTVALAAVLAASSSTVDEKVIGIPTSDRVSSQAAPAQAGPTQLAQPPEFGAEACIQNDNHAGSVWLPSMCLDLASLSVDEVHTYTSAIHVDKPLFDTDVPTIRLGGVAADGSRVWLVNFTHAAKTTAPNDPHPLHCIESGDSYRCQWSPTANTQEWSDYRNLQLDKVADMPSFFIVSKPLMDRKAVPAHAPNLPSRRP